MKESADGVIVSIHATPRASKSEVQGLHGDALKIRLQAPPVDGKANEALIAFLAERLGLPERRVTLIAGHTGRQKRVALQGLAAEEVSQILLNSSV